jgi:hypothetical protein
MLYVKSNASFIAVFILRGQAGLNFPISGNEESKALFCKQMQFNVKRFGSSFELN